MAFLSSKTTVAGVLGFLLSLFATELLFAVPKGMELEVAGLLLIPVIILMIQLAGLFGALRRRWWNWRRIITPLTVGILGEFLDESRKGQGCELQFQPNAGWKEFFSRKNSDSKHYEIYDIDWTEISSKYSIIVNPFGEMYLENDKRNLATYEKIKNFIAGGGIFCCTGGFPFYYYWDPITGKPIDTTPRTRTTEGNRIEDNRYFTDSLVTQDFGAIITSDPQRASLIRSYQITEDIDFFGDLSKAGHNDVIWEFRSLSSETRGVIPGLRVNHGSEVKYPLAALPFGKGYLIVTGMALKPDKVEFDKLSEGITNFGNGIARRNKSKWQIRYEKLRSKPGNLESQENISGKKTKNEKRTVAVAKTLVYLILCVVSLAISLSISYLTKDFIEEHNAFWSIALTPLLRFDFYGAIIPLVLGSFFVAVYFALSRSSVTKFVSCFLFSYVFALFFFQAKRVAIESIGIVGVPFEFAFVVGFLAAFVTLFSVSKPKKIVINVTKRNFAMGLLVAGAFGFLSVLCMDLTNYLVIGNMYVGAKGLADGILLSGIYSLPAFTLFAAFLAFCLELIKALGDLHQVKRELSVKQ